MLHMYKWEISEHMGIEPVGSEGFGIIFLSFLLLDFQQSLYWKTHSHMFFYYKSCTLSANKIQKSNLQFSWYDVEQSIQL